jgi:NADH dehydrogenase FAD-containing subunit
MMGRLEHPLQTDWVAGWLQVSRVSRMQEFQEAHDQIAAAGSIVIVGGGTVGVELAAEIVEAMPAGKKVRLA